jgi:hypothetical protein
MLGNSWWIEAVREKRIFRLDLWGRLFSISTKAEIHSS